MKGRARLSFLLAGDDFYFMEVNTRLQVEHPVTERITGIDLVEWQIRMAHGEDLPIQQHQLRCNGHAIEARIYAEDPDNNFLPAAGRIHYLEWPDQDGYIRVDVGVQQGDCVSSWYDPMLAKVIAWGKHREQALDKLTEALTTTCLAGLINNRNYLLALLRHAEFRRGNICTAFIDDYFSSGPGSLSPVQKRQLLTVAALFRYYSECSQSEAVLLPSIDSFPSYFYLDGKEYCVQVSPDNELFRLDFIDGSCEAKASWQREGHGFTGVVHLVEEALPCRVVPLPDQQLTIFLPDCSVELGLPGSQVGDSSTSDQALTAPMNGTVTAVNVTSGQAVDTGSVLLTMEAMKMEYSIKAPREGIIASVYFKPGDQVASGTALIAYQDSADATA